MTARRRSEETLAATGKETALDTAARLEREGQPTAAAALRRWVNTDPQTVVQLLRALPGTRGGNGRELRVAMCGVAFVARRGEAVSFARRSCKDRLCPSCGERRSRRFAARLRELVRELHGQGARLLFVTLTQPKVHMEEPKQALDRLLKSFRRWREQAWGKRYIIGGVRSLEVTARKAGTRIGEHVVTVGGIHAHLHCIVQVEPGVSAADIAGAWGHACKGASVAAVDVQEVTDENVYQVASYCVDMSGLLELLDVAPGYVKKVLGALHGRRLVEAFGEWGPPRGKDGRGKNYDLGLREVEGTLVYGDRAVYSLATNNPESPATLKWADGRVEPTEDVLAAFLAGQAEPL